MIRSGYVRDAVIGGLHPTPLRGADRVIVDFIGLHTNASGAKSIKLPCSD